MPTSARYFDLVREMRDAYNHRLRLVESVKERGIKPTARLFATSALTVRKWWRRYQQHGLSGLKEHSRAPRHHPLKTPAAVERQVLTLRQQLPTFGAARLKREFDLPLSHMAMQRIWREHGLLKISPSTGRKPNSSACRPFNTPRARFAAACCSGPSRKNAVPPPAPSSLLEFSNS